MKRGGWLFALALWTAVPAAPAAAQVSGEQDVQIADVEVLRRMVADLRATMLRPGARVAGWDRGGANPDADLRAMGEGFFFLNRDSDGTSVGIITQRPLSDFAPADWRIVDSYGSLGEVLPSPQLDFVHLSARYVMGTRTQFERRRDVDCASNFSGALLYEVPGAPAGPDDETIPIMFRLLILALEGQEICVRTEGSAASGYRGRMFRPDGTELPELSDPAGVTTIVPAAPIEQLLVPPSPRDDRPAV
jgi:hypothetical protein